MSEIHQNAKIERLKVVNRSGMEIPESADGSIFDLSVFKILTDKTKVFIFD